MESDTGSCSQCQRTTALGGHRHRHHIQHHRWPVRHRPEEWLGSQPDRHTHFRWQPGPKNDLCRQDDLMPSPDHALGAHGHGMVLGLQGRHLGPDRQRFAGGRGRTGWRSRQHREPEATQPQKSHRQHPCHRGATGQRGNGADGDSSGWLMRETTNRSRNGAALEILTLGPEPGSEPFTIPQS